MEDWGQLFDYSSSEVISSEGALATPSVNDKGSRPQKTHAAIMQIKNQFQAEKRKMKTQFEYDLKRVEVEYKQLLRTREKELAQKKAELAKKEEESQEKLKSLVATYQQQLEISYLRTHPVLLYYALQQEQKETEAAEDAQIMQQLQEEDKNQALEEKEAKLEETLESVKREQRYVTQSNLMVVES